MVANADIVRMRLYNQFISRPGFERPAEVVRWFGAVQAQEYQHSLWAIGLRMTGVVEADIERAAVDRAIVRTWPMRGTLHFVAADDIRWMLELMTPRIRATYANHLLKGWNVEGTVVARTGTLLESAMQGGKQFTRKEIYEVMERGGVDTANSRGLHILGQLAQLGVICIGAKKDKQHTFTLLDEWVPVSRKLERDEALAEISRRYFTSHGPATVQDLAWWTGLTLNDAKAGLEMVKPELVQEEMDGQTYWRTASDPGTGSISPTAVLLPFYDEYTVAYKDRSAVLDPEFTASTSYGLAPTVILDGKIVGTWKRELKKDSVVVTIQPLVKLAAAESDAVEVAATEYGRFLGLPVRLELKP